MAGAHKSVSIFYGIFEAVSLKILLRRILERRQIFFHYLLHAIWQRALETWPGLFKSKTKRRILEGMLTSCSGLEQLNFSG